MTFSEQVKLCRRAAFWAGLAVIAAIALNAVFMRMGSTDITQILVIPALGGTVIGFGCFVGGWMRPWQKHRFEKRTAGDADMKRLLARDVRTRMWLNLDRDGEDKDRQLDRS